MVFSLFKKKKKITTINIDDVDSWIKKMFESKNLSLKIGILKRELNSKKARIREYLQELEDAKIKDESVIPERAKNMFEGNKTAYIQKVNLFLDNFNYPEDISLIEPFLEDASLKLEELAKDTNKNYFIIKEFAEDEVRHVAGKIKEIDNVISSSRSSIEKTPISKFRLLKDYLDDYYTSVSLVEKTKQLMEIVLEKKGVELERKKKIETKIILLKKSPHYEDYKELKYKKEIIEDELKKTEYTVINLFSGISSVFKKYSKKKKNKLANSYSDDAVAALISDKDLSVIKILEDVVKLKDSLDIKDSKLKKLDSEVKAINKTSLDKLRNNLIKLNQDVIDVNNRLKNHSFMLNLKEQEGKISIVDQNINDIEKEEQEVENALERLSPILIKQKMKNLIKEIDEYTELI